MTSPVGTPMVDDVTVAVNIALRFPLIAIGELVSEVCEVAGVILKFAEPLLDASFPAAI